MPGWTNVYEQPFFPGRVTERTYESTNCRNCCKTQDLSVCECRTWPSRENEESLIARVGTDPVVLFEKDRASEAEFYEARPGLCARVRPEQNYRICFMSGCMLSVASLYTRLLVFGQKDIV